MESEEIPDGLAGVLLVGVDNFFAFDIKFRIVALTIIAGFFVIMSCVIDGSWSHSDTTRFGFWNHCFIGSPYTCCESFEDFLGDKPEWLKAALAFTCIAFIFSFVAAASVVCSMCVSNLKMRTHLMMHRVTPVCCVITALMLLISVSVVSNRHHKETWSEQNQISRTFFVAVVGLVLFVVDGAMLFFVPQNQVQDAIYPPDYWTKFTKTATIKEWLTKQNNKKAEVVDVSDAERDAVKHLIKKTWKSHLAGRGKDAIASGYKQMQVMDVQRIENPAVYEKYAEYRQKLLRRVRKTRGTLKRLDQIQGCRAVETAAHIPRNTNIFNDTHTDINEHYLFHGAGNDIIECIAQDGFDPRLAEEAGLFGKATYAAECPTKSDHYSGADSDFYNCKMILLRMILGDIYVTEAPCPFRLRPPCKKCVQNRSQDLFKCTDSSHNKQKDWMFDSVVGAIRHKHREFLVYDHAMCYPEYIITYNRV